MAIGSPKDIKKKKQGWYEANRCNYETMGKQCKFMGVFKEAPQSERQYCEWHSQVLPDPRNLNTYHRFLEWYQRQYDYFKIFKTQFSECPKDCEMEKNHKHSVMKDTTIWYLMGNEAGG